MNTKKPAPFIVQENLPDKEENAEPTEVISSVIRKTRCGREIRAPVKMNL